MRSADKDLHGADRPDADQRQQFGCHRLDEQVDLLHAGARYPWSAWTLPQKVIYLEETYKPATEPYTTFCGLDVGKEIHHATALTPAGKKIHDRPLPNDEPALREVFGKLAEIGQVLVVVDQPASISALSIPGRTPDGPRRGLPARAGDASPRRPAPG